MFDFLNFKKQVGSIKAQIDGLNDAIEGKKKELHHLRTSAPQKADVIAHFDVVIDRLGADYDAIFKFSVNRLSGDPLDFNKVDGIAILAAAPIHGAATIKTMEAAILAMFGDEIKIAMRKRIDALPWANDAGPRIAERPALIEKAERELSKLERDMADLRKQTTDAGIII